MWFSHIAVEVPRDNTRTNDYQTVVDAEYNIEASNFLPEIEKINIDLSKYDTIIL